MAEGVLISDVLPPITLCQGVNACDQVAYSTIIVLVLALYWFDTVRSDISDPFLSNPFILY